MLLGGSPLRQLRLTAAGRGAPDRRPPRRPGRPDRHPGRPAARRGCGAPRPAGTRPTSRTSPSSCRCATVPGELARLLAAVRADPTTRDGPARRRGRRLGRRRGGRAPRRRTLARRLVRHGTVPRAGRGPQRRSRRGRHDRPGRVPRLRLRAPARAGSRLLAPHLVDPRLAVVAPRITRPAARVDPAVSRPTTTSPARSTWARIPPRSARGPAVSYVPSAALLARRAALGRRVRRVDAGGRGRRPRLATGRRRLAGPVRAARRRRGTSTRSRRRTWLRRRAFYGTGAALLAARHGVGRRAGRPRADLGRRLGAAARRPAARPDRRRSASSPSTPCGWPAGWRRREPPGSRPGGRSGAARRGGGRPLPGPRRSPGTTGRWRCRRWRSRRCAGPSSRRPSSTPPRLVAAPRAHRSGPVRRRPAARGPRLRRRTVVGRGPVRRPDGPAPGSATADLQPVARDRTGPRLVESSSSGHDGRDMSHSARGVR